MPLYRPASRTTMRPVAAGVLGRGLQVTHYCGGTAVASAGNPEPPTRSGTVLGAWAGALTAAVLLFVVVTAPVSEAALASPFAHGWLPVILVFTLFWACVAAAGGAVAGALAAKVSRLVPAAL